MKNIIQRNLSLNTKYVLIDKKYIPLENSCGTTCDNCNHLIANIATVKDENNKVFNIGFDCLETVLINNQLLSGKDIEEYEKVKKMIPKILNFAKRVKETISRNASSNITGLRFEKQPYTSEWYTFYWLTNNLKTSRDNDNQKLKDMNYDFLIKTLKNIFPKLDIFIDNDTAS